MPVSMTYQGAVYYFGYDQVGSMRAVIDSTGTMVKRVDYDSFGNILSDSNLSFPVPFGFAGGLHDRDTGLVRFGARDYDPATGKWAAKDPIDFAGGDLNLLGYCLNDPISFIDPEGLLSFGENLARRRAINKGFGRSAAKFVAGLSIGTQFTRLAEKIGLGVGTRQALKALFTRGGGLVVLRNPRLGTIVNYAATAIAKAAVVGSAFYVGFDILGNTLGAIFDTVADNNRNSFLNNLGFGSGQANPCGNEALFSLGDLQDEFF